jgi:hypothetical protein
MAYASTAAPDASRAAVFAFLAPLSSFTVTPCAQ